MVSVQGGAKSKNNKGDVKYTLLSRALNIKESFMNEVRERAPTLVNTSLPGKKVCKDEVE